MVPPPQVFPTEFFPHLLPQTEYTWKNPEENKDQDLLYETEGDKCRRSSDCMRPLKSSIPESKMLQRKLKLQEKGRVEPRIEEIRIFLSVTTLNSLGYWTPKGWSPHHKSSQNRILSPSLIINRVNLENSWETYAIAFQGQRCNHLIIVLASQPLECDP